MILHNNDPYTQPSFSLRNRLHRLLWNIVYLLFFRLSPRPFHRWRAFLLRLFGATLGNQVHIYPAVNIWAPWNLTIGNHVGIADNVILYNMGPLHIGNYCVISQGAHLCGGSHDYNSRNFQLYARPIVIGAHSWICAEAFIHPGVNIPEGSVISARAVVKKTLEQPWVVYAGNPCIKIKDRINQITSTTNKQAENAKNYY